MNTLPTLPQALTVPIATSATNKVAIPVAQGGSDPANAVCQNDGFPPITSEPISTGGLPPRAVDFNGLFYMLSSITYLQQVGGLMPWNSTVSTAIGGYPLNAVLAWIDTSGVLHFIRSTKGDNTTVPSASTVGITGSYDWRDTVPTFDLLNLKANKTLDNVVSKSVVTALLNDGAVTSPKIGDGQVLSDNIGNLQVIQAKIGASAVVAEKIANGAVTDVKLANGAVTSDKLGTGIDVVVESWRATDGNSFYRKYKSGWIEQGGFKSGLTTINLPTPFTSANFTVNATWFQNANRTAICASLIVLSKTTTTLVMARMEYNGGDTYTDFFWSAAGF